MSMDGYECVDVCEWVFMGEWVLGVGVGIGGCGPLISRPVIEVMCVTATAHYYLAWQAQASPTTSITHVHPTLTNMPFTCSLSPSRVPPCSSAPSVCSHPLSLVGGQ